jgi:hypothetical protein
MFFPPFRRAGVETLATYKKAKGRRNWLVSQTKLKHPSPDNRSCSITPDDITDAARDCSHPCDDGAQSR